MNFKDFIKEIKVKGYNVEFGRCKTKLFGDEEKGFDKNGIKNRDLEIFYLIRKAKANNAPYLIFFNGGPGVGFSQHYFEHDGYQDFLPEVNLVLMDQRGTGYSSKPNNNLFEYQYFTSRYICSDAEKIKEVIQDKNEKWIVFGQSFGGHLVRKYLELYPESALIGISHGYGECSPITMKKYIELQLYKQVEKLFRKYPEDKTILEKIKNDLVDKDYIGNEIRKVYGKDILDIFSFYFGLYSTEKIHDILQSLNKDKLKKDFLKEISHIGSIVLNSGILNSVVAFIDLIGGITDEELYLKVEEELKMDKIEVEKEMFSFIRLAKNVKHESERIKELELLFRNKKFQIDPIDYSRLCKNLKKNQIILHVFGSLNDPITPIEAIEEEKERVLNNYNIGEYFRFHYSKGNHREWKENDNLFREII